VAAAAAPRPVRGRRLPESQTVHATVAVPAAAALHVAGTISSSMSSADTGLVLESLPLCSNSSNPPPPVAAQPATAAAVATHTEDVSSSSPPAASESDISALIGGAKSNNAHYDSQKRKRGTTEKADYCRRKGK
jgi:hypothetical protein